MEQPFIVGLGGTPRSGSSTEKALRISLAAAARTGARTVLLTADELMLPIYNPATTARCAHATRLISLLRRCDGLIISSPGYHGSVSGLVKNVLDYLEDMRNDDPPYLDGRSVGLIACAAGWQAPSATLATLRQIVHALRGWPTPLGAAINSAVAAPDASGPFSDPAVVRQLEEIGRQVAEFASSRIVRTVHDAVA